MNKGKKQQYVDEANEVLKERIELLNKNYLGVRDVYQTPYDWPELDPLRHEISICIMFGLYQAAITLTNHFLESLLKNTLITFYSKDKLASQTGDPIQGLIEGTREAREKYGNMNLRNTINAVHVAELISDKEKMMLDEFRVFIRNAYSHADKVKTFRDGTIPVQAANIDSGKLDVGDQQITRIADLIVGQGIVQAMIAEREAQIYFLQIDGLARILFIKLFGDSVSNAV